MEGSHDPSLDREGWQTMTPPPAIGDRIQWTINGTDRFTKPPAILALSSDGRYCFVEGTNTGLPIDQITVVEVKPPTADDISAWLRLVVEPGSVVEFRALNCVDNPRYPAFTVSGWFDHDHLDELAKTAMEWTGNAEGCYVTINPVRPDLLARAANRVVRKPKHTTTDADIVRRVGLVFDADPVRPAGISATEAEKALARELIDRLVSCLTARGWPAPILADSGNGFHARYKIDLAADDGRLVERILKAAAMFSDDRVKIDDSISNPSRIIKLYGTMSPRETISQPGRIGGLGCSPSRPISDSFLWIYWKPWPPKLGRPPPPRSPVRTAAPIPALGRCTSRTIRPPRPALEPTCSPPGFPIRLLAKGDTIGFSMWHAN